MIGSTVLETETEARAETYSFAALLPAGSPLLPAGRSGPDVERTSGPATGRRGEGVPP